MIIGFWVDIWKDNFKRKIRLREEHEEDIRKEVITPIYQELKKFYYPICEGRELPLEYQNCTIKKVPKDITEDSYGGVEPGILPRFSHLARSQEFDRFFDDALENHYPEILQEWGRFEDSFSKTTLKAVKYVEKIAEELKATFDLPPLPFSAHREEPGMNHERISVLIFKRQFGIDHESLRTYFETAVEGRTSNSNETLIRTKTIEHLNSIVQYVDKISKEKDKIEHIVGEYRRLGKTARYLVQELDQVLAQKPKLKKCPLV